MELPFLRIREENIESFVVWLCVAAMLLMMPNTACVKG